MGVTKCGEYRLYLVGGCRLIVHCSNVIARSDLQELNEKQCNFLECKNVWENETELKVTWTHLSQETNFNVCSYLYFPHSLQKCLRWENNHETIFVQNNDINSNIVTSIAVLSISALILCILLLERPQCVPMKYISFEFDFIHAFIISYQSVLTCCSCSTKMIQYNF